MTKQSSRAGTRVERRGNVANTDTANRSWVRARATVLVGEIRGFTQLTRRIDPEHSVRLLEEFYRSATDVAVAHRATIERVVGDGFVLLFESGAARREDGARAVRTGLALQRAFLALRNLWERDGLLRGGQLGLSVGIGSGSMVLAELDGVPGIHSVPFGEPLARASRLCQGGRAADVLLDEETFSACRRALEREVVFTSREVGVRGRDAVTAYKAQLRKAGLRVVSHRAVSDPVCGQVLSAKRTTERREYGGAVFHFCSRECAERFTDDPGSWLD